jgi:hypothetical protein
VEALFGKKRLEVRPQATPDGAKPSPTPHPSAVNVNIRSTEGPGLADLLVFAAGIATLLLVWAILLVGRVVL